MDMAKGGYFLGAVALFSLLWADSGKALKDHHLAQTKKMNRYLASGVFIGGAPGKSFALRQVRRKMGKKSGMERVVLDIGDHTGAPVKGGASYFHVQVDQKNRRVVMDLAQVQTTLLTETELRQKFQKSPYLRLKEIGYDPEGRSTYLAFDMLKPIKIEVFYPTSDKAPGRIVMDVLPTQKLVQSSTTHKKRR
jgi:hypothetical protein